jgi:hypothetical protein
MTPSGAAFAACRLPAHERSEAAADEVLGFSVSDDGRDLAWCLEESVSEWAITQGS